MSNPRRKTKPRTDEWPFIRFSEAENAWRVDARTKNGGSRKFFRTKAEAETYAQQCRNTKERHGASAFGNAELESYGKTVHQAITFYLEHLRQQSSSVPISDAVRELIETKRMAGRSEDYCYHIGLRLRRFSNEFPNRTTASFKAKELEAWLMGLGAAPGTRNTFRRDLHTLFSFCEKRGYCIGNEAAKTDRAKDIDKAPEILSVNQAIKFLAAAGDDTVPFVAIGMFAGLRTAELEKLDWAEVDLASGLIEVTAAKSKTSKRRLVRISQNLTAWIQPFAKASGTIAPVGLRKRLESLRERAGFKEWPSNALRHSYASYHLAHFNDAAALALQMGHTNTSMIFQHYREVVKPKDAARYWTITPVTAGTGVAAFATL